MSTDYLKENLVFHTFIMDNKQIFYLSYYYKRIHALILSFFFVYDDYIIDISLSKYLLLMTCDRL